MKITMIRQHAQSLPTVNVHTSQTLGLLVGRSLVALTAQQARKLASLLVVQAEVISPYEDRTNAAMAVPSQDSSNNDMNGYADDLAAVVREWHRSHYI